MKALSPTLFIAAVVSCLADDCIIHVLRRDSGGLPPRVVPAPNGNDIALVWQDGDHIFLQRFQWNSGGPFCPGNGVMEVNQSDAFWEEPHESGLADATTLVGGATAVAWLNKGNVWISVVTNGAPVGLPVQASGDQKIRRTDVNIVRHPCEHCGFTVAWSSWQQDGDGWGVFARQFSADGQPISEEIQVNQYWPQFQWRPQVAWCQDTLWALWLNGTGTFCPEGGGDACTNGPLLRPLASVMNGSSPWQPGHETLMPEQAPMASALDCGIGDNSAVALWLDRTGSQLNWQIQRPGLLGPGQHEASVLPLASRRLKVTPSYPILGGSTGFGVGSAFLVANVGLLALFAKDGEGRLQVQLIDYSIPKPYAPHVFSTMAESPRATWDVLNTQQGEKALIVCWASSAPLDRSFICTRKAASWLMAATEMGIGMEVVIFALSGVILLLCMLKTCHTCQSNRPFLLRRPFLLSMRGDETSGRRAEHQRELRQQLNRIPVRAPEAATVSVEIEGSQPGEAACPICHDRVFMRVALLPCGHTSCRSCASRLIDHSEVCHICRGAIDGFLPVYI